MLKQRNYNEMVTYILDKIRGMDISEDDKKTLFAYITSLESKYFMEMGNAERKGKWIEMGANKDGTHNIKCSKCGEGYKTRGHARSIATKTKYKFCPNCGSDNRGEEDADKDR